MAERLEPLTANVEIATYCPGFDPSLLRHRGIFGAADEAALNKVLKKIQKNLPLTTL